VALDDEDWLRRFIEARDDSVRIGRLALQGLPQPDVVAMVRIGAAIAVAEEAAVGEAVVVGLSRLGAAQPVAIRGDPLAAGRWR
jgi:hypothetical protein